MTDGHVPEQAQLPVALAVATGHEAQIVRRALRSAARAIHPGNKFTVVQVGVGCSDMDSTHIVDAYTSIISTGFAGALAPHIKSGTLLFAEGVKKTDNTTYLVDSDLQQLASRKLQASSVAGFLLHTDSLLATTMQKQRAHEKSLCIACDMESAALAAIAEQGGRPFACLRIILDPADTAIPDPIVHLANSQTEPTALAFLAAVLRHPRQLAATTVFLWHTFKASRALSRSVTKLVEGCCE